MPWSTCSDHTTPPHMPLILAATGLTPAGLVGLRDCALLLFYALTGMRRAEIASLR